VATVLQLVFHHIRMSLPTNTSYNVTAAEEQPDLCELILIRM